MDSRHPTECLTAEESLKLRDLVRLRGEREAIALVGRLNKATFYKAASGAPVARLTVEVIRGSLDRI